LLELTEAVVVKEVLDTANNFIFSEGNFIDEVVMEVVDEDVCLGMKWKQRYAGVPKGPIIVALRLLHCVRSYQNVILKSMRCL